MAAFVYTVNGHKHVHISRRHWVRFIQIFLSARLVSWISVDLSEFPSPFFSSPHSCTVSPFQHYAHPPSLPHSHIQTPPHPHHDPCSSSPHLPLRRPLSLYTGRPIVCTARPVNDGTWKRVSTNTEQLKQNNNKNHHYAMPLLALMQERPVSFSRLRTLNGEL